MPPRHLIISLSGHELSPQEATLLQSPAVSGVLLLSHNFKTKTQPDGTEGLEGDLAQVASLTQSIRAQRTPCGDADTFLISADFEGSPVWRAKNTRGEPWTHWFQAHQPLRQLGLAFESASQDERPSLLLAAERLAEDLGHALRALGINMNYAPVLDSHHAHSSIIGARQRAFSSDPETIFCLAHAFLSGFKKAGIHGVAKHFPDHGFAHADSHVTHTEDPRSLDALTSHLRIYQRLSEASVLDYVMTAHVRYPQVDPDHVASRSPLWHQLLRDTGFSGQIISDCMMMKGSGPEAIWHRIQTAFEAGTHHVILGGFPSSHPLHALFPALAPDALMEIIRLMEENTRSQHQTIDR